MGNFLLLLALTVLPLTAQAYENDLDGLLNDHVKFVEANGIQYNGVNYDDWGKDPRHATVRDAILAVNPSSLTSDNEWLAYWINTYNVLTIDLITRTGEQESIRNLGTVFKTPWKRYKWTIAGKEVSLDDIEHKIIRKEGDARIHFAVNCAAKSCPDLRMEAYRGSKLDVQLDQQTRITFNNKTKGYILEGGNVVRVSKVMDWFGEDFNDGDLNSWLTTYKPDAVNSGTEVKFLDYDWSLNKQSL